MCSCVSNNAHISESTQNQTTSSVETEAETTKSTTVVTSAKTTTVFTTTSPPKIQLNTKELDKLASNWGADVIGHKILVQSSEHKILYPDLLSVTVKNNTRFDIKDITIRYYAWDANNLPVKIKGSIDFSGGYYCVSGKAEAVNIVPGGTYGSTSGYSIDEDCKIKTFKGYVEDFTTFNGSTFVNPYLSFLSEMYEGKKREQDLQIEVDQKELENAKEKSSVVK